MDNKTGKQSPSLWIPVLILGIVVAIIYSFFIGRSMAERYVPLLGAVTEIKFEVTIAHLRLEEAISGDQSIGIEAILEHIDLSVQYAQGMLEGGKIRGSKIIPLEETALRNKIEHTLKGVRVFRVMAQERWSTRTQYAPGSAIVQKFDKKFAAFITYIDDVKVLLQKAIDTQLRQFYYLQGILIICIGLLGIVTHFMIRHYELRRTMDMQALLAGEKTLTKANRLYATLNHINQAIVRAHDKHTLMQEICDIATDQGKFKLAWIGFIEDGSKLIKPAVFSGDGADYMQYIEISILDDAAGRGPTGRSIREAKHIVFNDLENNPDYTPWREAAMEKGYRSSAAFPIKLYGSVIGVLSVYAAEAYFFDTDEVNLLEEVTQDIALALGKFAAEEKHKQAEEVLSSHLCFLQGIARINHTIQQTTDIEQVMSDALQVMLEVFKVDRAWLFFPCDPDAQSWNISMERTRPDYPGAHALGKAIPMQPEVASILREALEKDDVITFDYGNQSAPGDVNAHFSILSQMHMAIHPLTGKPWMLGMHQCSHYRDWTNEEKYLFYEIGYRLGNALSTLLITRDLQESEAKLRSIFQSSVVGMIVAIDGDGCITEWNAGAEQAFGYSAEEAEGQPLTLLMPECYRKAHTTGFARAVAQGGLSHGGVTHEVRGLRKDGREFPLELTLGSWKRGETLYFSAIILDITERKQSEAVLRRSQKMEAVGQLTGGIAHDFNNILGIILGNVDLLKRHIKGDAKALKRIDTIEKSALRAADLTKQLLGFSRSQAAQTAVTDINRVLNDMGSLIRRSVTPAVEIQQEFANDLWFADIDPGDFQDAVLNLVINARDAMPNGGHLIMETSNCHLDANYCALNPGLSPGNYVQLMIRDNGEGIQPEILEHIFEPFFTTKELGKGTGLGLAMVFGFAKRSKGSIDAASEPGIGTTFRLHLPQAEVGGQVQREQVTKSVDEPTQEFLQGHETILVVDDEDALLELAQTTLQKLGYRVITAVDGQQALARLAEDSTIDLLFSDVVMPGGITGYELAEKATISHPDIKVLLTTGYAKTAIKQSGQTDSPADLLAKPYTRDELVMQVRAVLRAPERVHTDLDAPQDPEAESFDYQAEMQRILITGIDVIDSDHKALLAILNQCHQAVASGDTTRGADILKQLWLYTKTHFRREEEVMKVCDYPELNNHCQVHQLLVRQVKKMQTACVLGILSTADLKEFTSDWVFDHINGMDRAFAQYCAGKEDFIEQALEKIDSMSEQEGS